MTTRSKPCVYSAALSVLKCEQPESVQPMTDAFYSVDSTQDFSAFWSDFVASRSSCRASMNSRFWPSRCIFLRALSSWALHFLVSSRASRSSSAFSVRTTLSSKMFYTLEEARATEPILTAQQRSPLRPSNKLSTAQFDGPVTNTRASGWAFR